MKSLAVNLTDSPQETLKAIQSALNSKDGITPIDADFHFTKGKPGRTSGYILRDKSLENEVIF